MPNRVRPFVLYTGGWLNFMIVPRGVKGWAQFAIWIALLVPLVLWLDGHLDSSRTGPAYGDGLLLFFAAAAAWLIGGLWWMLANSEVVSVVELRRERQYDRMRQQRRHHEG